VAVVRFCRIYAAEVIAIRHYLKDTWKSGGRFSSGWFSMLVQERRNQLMELVRTRRFASLPELAEALAVSESTIRRDLDYLEDQGTAKRIHGGSCTAA